MGVLLKADKLSLDVPVYLQRERENQSWLGLLLGAALDPPRRENRTLLRSVSFEAREGDRIALLGLNGAGKSTLLRVLNGAYVPTSGTLTVGGTRQALLNISLGFNNEATVRENIYLRGTAMGMKASLIRELVQPILEFSGLQEKALHRLRTLSSGQRMRLGFAISTAIQHDIMLMDEWVGTGDANFLAKAKERMLNRVAGSKIVVLASHSLGLLRDVCNRGLVLERGEIVFDGSVDEALKNYKEVVERAQASNEGGERIETAGALDEVELHDGVLHLKGWALQGFIAMPKTLAVEVNGTLYPISDYEHYPRVDVQRHFGLHDPMCGFVAKVAIPGVDSLADLGKELGFYGGASLDQLDGPFRVAPAVRSKLGH
ncbi:Teichoic acids export ATP-binding protein TagH [compost metagenome]